MKKNAKLICMLVLGMIILDQITKFFFLKNKQTVVLENTGNNGYYILVSIVTIFLIIRYLLSNNSFIKKDTRIVLEIGLAGIIGNLLDRFFYGYVIVFKNLFDLNLAYIYIAITWIGMAWILAKNSYKFLKDKRERHGFKGK